MLNNIMYVFLERLRQINTCNRSRTTSAKPTVLRAHARALAKEKTIPIGPPISGPREREIMKYAPPGIDVQPKRSDTETWLSSQNTVDGGILNI